MKHKSNKGTYTEAFRRDLLRVYKETLREHHQRGLVVFGDVIRDTIVKPSKRFWVSEEQAYTNVVKIMNGEQSTKNLPTKQDMYMEIYRRVMALWEKNPDRPLKDIVFEVCDQPAPRFYLTPKSARTIIFNILKCRREKNLQ